MGPVSDSEEVHGSASPAWPGLGDTRWCLGVSELENSVKRVVADVLQYLVVPARVVASVRLWTWPYPSSLPSGLVRGVVALHFVDVAPACAVSGVVLGGDEELGSFREAVPGEEARLHSLAPDREVDTSPVDFDPRGATDGTEGGLGLARGRVLEGPVPVEQVQAEPTHHTSDLVEFRFLLEDFRSDLHSDLPQCYHL
ncbi:MAG TPA: hypothetical protein DEB09_02710 [Candidatus Magasanikbacteria bacterium]|nr:hypothetical protein [Candidatus Magasanikbacteria bacterium]